MPAKKHRKTYVPFSPTKKRVAQHLYQSGSTLKEIAEELDVSVSSTSRNLRTLGTSTDYYAQSSRAGRPRALSRQKRTAIKLAIKSGQYPDATAAQRAMAPDVSAETVHRALTEMGLPGRRRRKVAVLNKKHAAGRILWAKEHAKWSEADWLRAFFSDECRLNKEGSDGLQWCRRAEGEAFEAQNVDPQTAYGGGGLMVFGIITPKGVGRLHRVFGTVNAVNYINILSDTLLPSFDDAEMDCTTAIFQQDGARAHTAKITQSWFASHNITTLPWPSHSPDLNIIEHVWAYLKQQVRTKLPVAKSLDDLWEVTEQEWYAIPDSVIANLYASMTARVQAVIEADGWYTKY